MSPKKSKIAISCGELSGDEHGAAVCKALRKQNPSVEIRGMGGRNLRAAGVDTVVDSETAASVMGFADVLLALPRIIGAMNDLKKLLKEWQPEILILVDYPDFNLRLARYAKSLGIKVLYYISPQVWAWRSKRVELFKKYIDQIVTLFPFEIEFLKTRGYENANFFGYPLIDQFDQRKNLDKNEIRRTLGLPTDKKLIAVFPGSRKHEIERMLSVIRDGVNAYLSKRSDVQAVLNIAPSIDEEMVYAITGKSDQIKVVKVNPLDVLQCCDAGVLKSGTSNLQAALLGLPFLMIYKASALSEIIIKTFVKIKQYSIVNILRPNSVVELLQENVNSLEIARNLERLIEDQEYRDQVKSAFKEIENSLHYSENSPLYSKYQTTSERVAALALSMCSA